jgi:hypothetical protein
MEEGYCIVFGGLLWEYVEGYKGIIGMVLWVIMVLYGMLYLYGLGQAQALVKICVAELAIG